MTSSVEATAMTDAPSGSVSIVTVTYGDRLHLLEQVVHACLTDPAVADMHLVSNNSKSDLTGLEARWGDRLKVIRLDRNMGSAIGFGKGIESALAGERAQIMLLDDDNVPGPGCIDALLEELSRVQSRVGPSLAGVAASRAFHHPDIATAALSPAYVYGRPSRFMGFNLFHRLVRRRLMRLFGRHRLPPGTTSIVVPSVPYGGYLAAAEAYRKIGTPNADLVLYSDDIEYTYRLTKLGGEIRLVLNTLVDDLDTRQGINMEARSVFSRLLGAPSAFRLYYSVRNQVWFEQNPWSHVALYQSVNRAMFLFFMKREARRLGMPENYEIFMSAVRDGEAGRLGANDRFPLPD